MWNDLPETAVAYNPMAALKGAQWARDVVQTLVPERGVTWLFGPSMSFKSFTAMSLAASVAAGRPWLGREVTPSVVLYVGAEGGDALHIRRAGAEMALEDNGRDPIVVAQERPQLDRESGLWAMRGILDGVIGSVWLQDSTFEDAVDGLCFKNSLEYKVSHDCLKVDIARKNGVARRIRAGEAGLTEALREAEERVQQGRAKMQEHRQAALGTHGLLFESMSQKYLCDGLDVEPDHRNILCIIDTFAQTASDDDRARVSAYIKNLRTLIEEVGVHDYSLSFIVVDHVTKEGSTYLGSVAKLNDVDSQLELTRVRRTMVATLEQAKNKNGAEGPAVILEMQPYELTGFLTSTCDRLSTLVVRDGTQALAAMSLNPDGNVAMLMDFVKGGVTAEKELKAAFREAKVAAGVKYESADKAYRRAMQILTEDGAIQVNEGQIVVS